MPEELKETYHQYQQGKISRRDFISKAVVVTGSLAAANSLLAGGVREAVAAAVGDDADLRAQTVEYPGKAGTVAGYIARPAKGGKYPAIIVIHENQGLNDHIRDV